MQLNRLLFIILVLVTAAWIANGWAQHQDAVYHKTLQRLYSAKTNIGTIVVILNEYDSVRKQVLQPLLIKEIQSLRNNINAIKNDTASISETNTRVVLSRFASLLAHWHSNIYPQLVMLMQPKHGLAEQGQYASLLDLLVELDSDLQQTINAITAEDSVLAKIAQSLAVVLLILLLSLLSFILFKHTSNGKPANNNVQADSNRDTTGLNNSLAIPAVTSSRRDNDGSANLIHEALTLLVEQPESTEPLKLLLKEVNKLIGAVSSTIYVAADPSSELTQWACTNPEDDGWANVVTEQILVEAVSLETDISFIESIEGTNKSGIKYCCVRLYHGRQDYSLLVMKCHTNFQLTNSLKNTLAEHTKRLANIVSSVRLARLKLRNAQYDERAVIARELHDSLAQSLSYLKIQTSRLQKILATSELQEYSGAMEIDSIMQDIRTNLNITYRHLRELISTFRLTMDGKNFSQALTDSVGEFSKRSGVAFDIDNRLPSGLLTVAEETQLLHIIRESLSNVVRHSHAQFATISVHCNDNGEVKASVEDDGVGFPDISDREQHFGIIVMQERAHSIGGNINLSKITGGGTCFSVTFLANKCNTANIRKYKEHCMNAT